MYHVETAQTHSERAPNMPAGRSEALAAVESHFTPAGVAQNTPLSNLTLLGPRQVGFVTSGGGFSQRWF